MHISPLELYFILQLDSIIGVLGFVSGMSLFVICMIVLGIVIAHAADSYHENTVHERFAPYSKFIKKTAVVTVVTGALATFLPSTKNAAAIVVIPAIVNNETIQREAADLYGMAKQALKDAITEKTSTEKTGE